MSSKIPVDDFGHTNYNDNELDNEMAMQGKMEGTPVSADTRSTEECRVSLERVDTSMEIDLRRDSDPGSISERTRSKVERGRAGKAPPPGSTNPREKCGNCSRSSSVSSASSRASDAATARKAKRRKQREAAHEANRRAAAATNPNEGEEVSSIVSLTDDEGEEVGCSHSASRDSSLKRKADCEGPSEATQSKQGRQLQTTGLYVGRAAAIEKYIEKKKEEARIDQERVYLNMPTGRLYSSILNDVEDAVEKFEYNTTADVAERVRHHMTEVVRVAKSSRNLQGGYQKILKHAAVIGVASAEVFRTRADRDGTDSEALREIKALRRELEVSRQEAKTAKEEAEEAKKMAEALREELVKAGVHRRRGDVRRRVIDDDDSPRCPRLGGSLTVEWRRSLI